MTADQILSDLESTIRQFIEPLDSKVVPSATLKDDLGIDSMTQIDLLIQIERSYEVTFSDEDVARFVRVADIIDFLAERLPELGFGQDRSRIGAAGNGIEVLSATLR